MTRFRLTAGATVVTAAGVCAAVLSTGLPPNQVVAALFRWGRPLLALWVLWLLLAPAVLIVAALVVRRTPWPWVVAVAVHLASLLVGIIRFGHWVGTPAGLVLLVTVCVGLASVMAAVGAGVGGTTRSRPDSVP